MPSDFETFDEANEDQNRRYRPKNKRNKNRSKDDFISMFQELFNAINFKGAIVIFILGLFLFSDIFVNNFLSGIPGSVDETENTTTSGTVIQLTFLTIGFLIFDLLIKGEVV
jgi:hypothetical protein